ncbi:MAG: DUF927 domain-containing protein [Planctomycetes bacterium]|nr:DUF927 domain-containing protein [Planctomycetota bacterium]
MAKTWRWRDEGPSEQKEARGDAKRREIETGILDLPARERLWLCYHAIEDAFHEMPKSQRNPLRSSRQIIVQNMLRLCTEKMLRGDLAKIAAKQKAVDNSLAPSSSEKEQKKRDTLRKLALQVDIGHLRSVVENVLRGIDGDVRVAEEARALQEGRNRTSVVAACASPVPAAPARESVGPPPAASPSGETSRGRVLRRWKDIGSPLGLGASAAKAFFRESVKAGLPMPIERDGITPIASENDLLRWFQNWSQERIRTNQAPIPRRQIFTITGWREIGSRRCYLTGEAVVAADGKVTGVEVSLPNSLSRFALASPPRSEALTGAVTASLPLLDVGPDTVTFPLLAAIYRASLRAADFGLHLAGRTRAGKSELAALAQQHYGAALDSRNLPRAWSSTGNALERLAFLAKDALIVVDDGLRPAQRGPEGRAPRSLEVRICAVIFARAPRLA